MSIVRNAVFGGLLVLVSSSAPAGLLVAPDPDWKEGEHSMPPPPSEHDLREFSINAPTANRFFIDESSLSVGEDGVVRYVLVVRSRGGARNVTYEGIRCASGEHRIYATGRSSGEWAPARNSEWFPISDKSYNRVRAALAVDYFCDGPAAPRDRSEALRRLGGERGPGYPAL